MHFNLVSFSSIGLLSACVVQSVAAEQGAEEETSQMAVAIAATLLGAITFQMGLFCLTNHPDMDMRKYTYEVVSATVSIFCAVLLFQSANDLVEAYILEGTSLGFQVMVDMLHMLLWYSILQLTLAYLSGAIGEPPEDMDEVELNMKCFAVILAHMTGFASINAWGSVQELPFFKSSPWMSFLVLPISAIAQLALERATDNIRIRVSLADDGETDEFEKAWDEECEDAENDVMGLTLSFNMTQAVRFLISGFLPDQEGGEPWEQLIHAHSGSQMCTLFAIGLVAIILMMILYMRKPNRELSELTERLLSTVYIILAMAFAWCVFFAFRWTLASVTLLHDPMLLAVAVAMVVSLASFSSIRVLDLVSDHLEALAAGDDGHAEAELSTADAIRHAIAGIGILVGFAWEQCFDQAVESLSSVLPMQHLSKTLLALGAVAIIGPAWKWWILPMVVAGGWRYGFVMDHKNELLQEGAVSLIEKHLDQPDVQARIQSMGAAGIQAEDDNSPPGSPEARHMRLKKLHDRLAGHFAEKRRTSHRGSRKSMMRASIRGSFIRSPTREITAQPKESAESCYAPLPASPSNAVDAAPKQEAPPTALAAPAPAPSAPSPVAKAEGNKRLGSAIQEALEALRMRELEAQSKRSGLEDLNSQMDALVQRMTSLEAKVCRS